MKENFLNLMKEIDMQVQEVQRDPNKMDAKGHTPRHIIIKTPKVKDKERIIKAVREKQLVTCRVVPIGLSADFSKETLQVRRAWQGNQSGEKQEITIQITLSSKAIIQN